MATSTIKGQQTGTFTASANWTEVDAVSVVQNGNVCQVNGTVSYTGNTGTTEVQVGTISGIALPKSAIRAIGGRTTTNWGYNAVDACYCSLGIDGGIRVKTPTASKTFTFNFTYIA